MDTMLELIDDPYPYFAEKRRTGGLCEGTVMDHSRLPESSRTMNSYLAVSYEAVTAVLRDGTAFNSKNYDATIGPLMGPTILAMEGAKHRAHRGLVAAAFKSQSLEVWEPAIVRPICNALIDEFAGAGRADLVREFTVEFPTRVITRLLGLPEEDLSFFRARAVELLTFNADYARGAKASAALQDYFLDQIERRRTAPTPDIIGDLVAAEIDGERLSDEAIYSFLRLLLLAGLETTYRSSGNLLFHLLTRPGQFEMVRRDRALIPAAVEEGLRFETPLTTIRRHATTDADVAGTRIPAGSVVDVCLGGANRDEHRWERADEFDITRKRLPHISFAAGPHTCLGLQLARMETRVALECLLDRLTNITLLPSPDTRIQGHPFRSPVALPVTFESID
ncbi:cytochrome P450 [Nocardia sp. BMG51109]|uniref:cytochrome P450 n=1 Tax=Nocardia sp. BMG51109 TaxID=1056816 RepID=UPI000467133A|nr:cytochrome P450 [Nocardia sp. BMG51109]